MSEKDWVLVPRVPTGAMVEAICAAVAQADWPHAYFGPAQQRRRRDARLAWLEAVAAAPNQDAQQRSQTDAPICPWCERQGWDICQHADDARTCGK